MRSTMFLTVALTLLVSPLAGASDVVVDVKLSPAGSFQMKTSEVSGQAFQKGDTITAENIVVKLANIKTGIALRDDHTKNKYLEVQKFPEATLVKAIGKGGQGKAKVRIRGIEKEVSGQYVTEGGMLKAKFPLKVSEFGITGVKYMGVGVKDEVMVNIEVPVAKK